MGVNLEREKRGARLAALAAAILLGLLVMRAESMRRPAPLVLGAEEGSLPVSSTMQSLPSGQAL